MGNVLRLHLHAFFGFHRLVETIRPAPAGHQPPGELIHNDHVICLNDVVLVAAEKELRPQCLFQVSQHARLLRCDILGAVRVTQRRTQQFFHMHQSDLGQGYRAVLFHHFIILRHQCFHHQGHAAVVFRIILGGTGNDQWGARFIYKDIVDLIDDGVMVTTLHTLLKAHRDVVAQIVKTKFAVGAVCYVCEVGLPALDRSQLVLFFKKRIFIGVKYVCQLAILGQRCHL